MFNIDFHDVYISYRVRKIIIISACAAGALLLLIGILVFVLGRKEKVEDSGLGTVAFVEGFQTISNDKEPTMKLDELYYALNTYNNNVKAYNISDGVELYSFDATYWYNYYMCESEEAAASFVNTKAAEFDAEHYTMENAGENLVKISENNSNNVYYIYLTGRSVTVSFTENTIMPANTMQSILTEISSMEYPSVMTATPISEQLNVTKIFKENTITCKVTKSDWKVGDTIVYLDRDTLIVKTKGTTEDYVTIGYDLDANLLYLIPYNDFASICEDFGINTNLAIAVYLQNMGKIDYHAGEAEPIHIDTDLFTYSFISNYLDMIYENGLSDEDLIVATKYQQFGGDRNSLKQPSIFKTQNLTDYVIAPGDFVYDFQGNYYGFIGEPVIKLYIDEYNNTENIKLRMPNRNYIWAYITEEKAICNVMSKDYLDVVDEAVDRCLYQITYGQSRMASDNQIKIDDFFVTNGVYPNDVVTHATASKRTAFIGYNKATDTWYILQDIGLNWMVRISVQTTNGKPITDVEEIAKLALLNY